MTPYDVIQITDINLSELKLVKETCQWFGDQDHSRWVFRTRENVSGENDAFFFKIWNPTYIRRDHVLQGMESGFYDATTIPAFYGFIFAKGICRGYVMRKCLPYRRKDPDFYALILKKTAQTGFFCVQYSQFHAMRYGEKFSLVDLEAIHALAEFPFLSSYYPRCFFDDPEYERFVANLYCLKFPHLDAPPPAKQAHDTPNFLPEKIRYPYRKVRSIFRKLYRALAIRLGTVFNHIDQIEY
jgi:hypothetical protein